MTKIYLKKEKYEIKADCQSYSEWSVDDEGELLYSEHEFEGHDIIGYKIVDENGDSIYENKSFKRIKAKLAKLNK